MLAMYWYYYIARKIIADYFKLETSQFEEFLSFQLQTAEKITGEAPLDTSVAIHFITYLNKFCIAKINLPDIYAITETKHLAALIIPCLTMAIKLRHENAIDTIKQKFFIFEKWQELNQTFDKKFLLESEKALMTSLGFLLTVKHEEVLSLLDYNFFRLLFNDSNNTNQELVTSFYAADWDLLQYGLEIGNSHDVNYKSIYDHLDNLIRTSSNTQILPKLNDQIITFLPKLKEKIETLTDKSVLRDFISLENPQFIIIIKNILIQIQKTFQDKLRFYRETEANIHQEFEKIKSYPETRNAYKFWKHDSIFKPIKTSNQNYMSHANYIHDQATSHEAIIANLNLNIQLLQNIMPTNNNATNKELSISLEPQISSFKSIKEISFFKFNVVSTINDQLPNEFDDIQKKEICAEIASFYQTVFMNLNNKLKRTNENLLDRKSFLTGTKFLEILDGTNHKLFSTNPMDVKAIQSLITKILSEIEKKRSYLDDNYFFYSELLDESFKFYLEFKSPLNDETINNHKNNIENLLKLIQKISSQGNLTNSSVQQKLITLNDQLKSLNNIISIKEQLKISSTIKDEISQTCLSLYKLCKSQFENTNSWYNFLRTGENSIKEHALYFRLFECQPANDLYYQLKTAN